jgi:hypothetical protein
MMKCSGMPVRRMGMNDVHVRKMTGNDCEDGEK